MIGLRCCIINTILDCIMYSTSQKFIAKRRISGKRKNKVNYKPCVFYPTNQLTHSNCYSLMTLVVYALIGEHLNGRTF